MSCGAPAMAVMRAMLATLMLFLPIAALALFLFLQR
jgi:hypothetical protein